MAEPCPLCLAAAQPMLTRPRDTRFTPLVDALLPWLLAFGSVAPLSFAVDGEARIFFAGIACGVLVGAAFAWQLHRRDRATGRAATARVRAEISAESDARANAVLMQFEWAVHDITTLREKLERTEREAREHAQHAFATERDVVVSSASCASGTAGARCGWSKMLRPRPSRPPGRSGSRPRRSRSAVS